MYLADHILVKESPLCQRGFIVQKFLWCFFLSEVVNLIFIKITRKTESSSNYNLFEQNPQTLVCNIRTLLNLFKLIVLHVTVKFIAKGIEPQSKTLIFQSLIATQCRTYQIFQIMNSYEQNNPGFKYQRSLSSGCQSNLSNLGETNAKNLKKSP